MKTTEELLPCPNCGHTPGWTDWQSAPDGRRMQRFCAKCDLAGPSAKTLENAAIAWNALPRRLRWTRERPTKEGWYWYKHDDGQRIIGRLFHGGLHFPGGNFNSLKDMSGEWAGPIPGPEEATA